MARRGGGRSTFFSIYLFYIVMALIVLPVAGAIFFAVQTLGLSPFAGAAMLMAIPVIVVALIFFRRRRRWEALQGELEENREKAEERDRIRESKGLPVGSEPDGEEEEWLRAARARAKNSRCPQCSKKIKHETGLYCDFKDRRKPRCLIGPFCTDSCLKDHIEQHPRVEHVPER